MAEDIEKKNTITEVEESSDTEANLDVIVSEAEIESTEIVKKRNVNNKGFNVKKILIVFAVSLLVIFISISIGVALSNKFNDNVYKGIYMGDKDLSGMTESEVAQYVKTKKESIDKKNISVEQGDTFLITIDGSDFDLELDEIKTVENIMEYGRNKDLIKNNIDVVKAIFKNQNIDMAYTYNEEKLAAVIKEVKEIIVGKTIDDNYTLDEKAFKLILNKGKAGISIDEETFKLDLIKILTTNDGEKLKIKEIQSNPAKLDVDVIYSKVVREPKDAYIDKSTDKTKFIPHQTGLSFDKEALREVIDNMAIGGSSELKLISTEPKIKLADITWDLYNYQVSTYKTFFATTDANRVNNLGVALNILNGTVIMPGEIFSYNGTVGSASAAQGFLPAGTFVGGTIVREVGGGICQTVSTLYNSAILANLEIVQRKNHSLPVGYVPGSRDATVYYPSVDFKFKNTREYPIKIVTSFNKGGNLSISLFGTKEADEASVSISSRTLSYLPYRTDEVQDSTLDVGVQVVKQNGANGYISEAYKTTTINGKSTTVFLSKDTYKPVNKIVRVGTKAVAAVAPTVVTPEPEVPAAPAEAPVPETPVA